ncbi:MAG: PepSY-associated TM helix domain-containing protein [Vicinamibacterales bacterium]
MPTFRTLLFWTHLTIGVAAGVVILLMCVTGVALTYEKQMLEWADRSTVTTATFGAPPVPMEALLASAANAAGGATPTGLTLRAHPAAPATVTFEGGRVLLIDRVSGQSLGEPSPGLRRFFRTMTTWHRWLALEGRSRTTGRAVTGAANLGFLFIVLSGMYLWLPKAITWVQLRQVLWFRSGLQAKARDFNWHNVIGIWSAIPLALVVAGAVPISYNWAGALVYRLAGDTPPAPAARGTDGRRAAPAVPAPGLDGAIAAATSAVDDWRTMSIRWAADAVPLTIAVDRGYGGQPQHRTTFTVDRTSAQITRRESFADQGPGRQWRSWFRFVHTGEYYGLAGQTIAGAASAGGAVLVYTGVALSLRRFAAWRRRRQAPRVASGVAA